MTSGPIRLTEEEQRHFRRAAEDPFFDAHIALLQSLARRVLAAQESDERVSIMEIREGFVHFCKHLPNVTRDKKPFFEAADAILAAVAEFMRAPDHPEVRCVDLERKLRKLVRPS